MKIKTFTFGNKSINNGYPKVALKAVSGGSDAGKDEQPEA